MTWFGGKKDENDNQSGQPKFTKDRNTQLSREQARKDKLDKTSGKAARKGGKGL